MTTKRTVTRVDIGELIVDPAVQRVLDLARVDRMAAAFNPDALGVLTYSLRDDGSKAILDGQTRHAAAVRVNFSGVVDAVQYQGLTPAEEAVLFLALNDTKQVSALDKFKARVLAEDPDAVTIHQAVTDWGWRVQYSKDDWCLSAISSVERIYQGSGLHKHLNGEVLLRDVLEVLSKAWNGQANSSNTAILASLGKFLGHYGNQIERDKLIHELAQVKPMNLVADIRATKDMQRSDMANAGALIITGIYNRRRRAGRLPTWTTR